MTGGSRAVDTKTTKTTAAEKAVISRHAGQALSLLSHSRSSEGPEGEHKQNASQLAPTLGVQPVGMDHMEIVSVDQELSFQAHAEAHERAAEEASQAVAAGTHAKSKDSESRGVRQLILWACIAAILTICGVSVAYLFLHLNRTHKADVSREALRQHKMPGSLRSSGKSSLAASERGVSSQENVSGDTGISSSTEGRSQRGTLLPGLPLCHLLVVPDGTRLACVVQNDVRRRKQEIAFDISAVPARGGAPLFRMRVSELGRESPGIFVETLGSREQLAFLSTEDLWQGNTTRPKLSISRPWGLPYGEVQKSENGEYVVARGGTTLLVLTGDFASHTAQVLNSNGQQIATTLQTSPEEYQVHMLSRTDAGLVILALLAIDKIEANDPDRP
jgi:hypothetical protein